MAALSMEFLDAEMTEMFQQEFKKLHVDLANKEIKLFKHMFNHYLSKRIVKIEQFLREYFDDFDSFKPVERKRAHPSSYGSSSNPPAKRGPKPKHSSQHQQEQPQTQKSVKVKSEPYPDLDDDEIDLINGFQGHFLDETSEDGMGESRMGQGDSEDDDDDFSSFALQHLETSTPNANKSSSLNGSTGGGGGSGSGGGGGAKCGRKRNAIWQCYETTFSDDGKVLTNDCLRCGQAVSAKAGRMRSHLMKCREIMREATRYKRSVGDVKRPKNQYSQGYHKPNYSSSSANANQSMNNSSTSTSNSGYIGTSGSTTTEYNSGTVTPGSTMNYGGGGNVGVESTSNYGTPSSTVGVGYGGTPTSTESYGGGGSHAHGTHTPGSGYGSSSGVPDSTASNPTTGSEIPCSTSPGSGHVPYVGSSSGSA